jgi:hypothetical protein
VMVHSVNHQRRDGAISVTAEDDEKASGALPMAEASTRLQELDEVAKAAGM